MTNPRAWERTYREQRRARGVCRDCPARVDRYVYCTACRAKRARMRGKYREKAA